MSQDASNNQSPGPTLCAPSLNLSCFACCPPLRPAVYDHADHVGSLTRLLRENTAAFGAGLLPQRPEVGFFCAGLGFVNSARAQVGCLLHPARNQGRDLRHLTGYGDKCRRETCAQARCFARLSPEAAAHLLELCQGMDSFVFSSPRLNPVRRLLAWGPEVAGAAAGLGAGRSTLEGWAWLARGDPGLGWLLGRLLEVAGPGLLARPGLALGLEAAAASLRRALEPLPPVGGGQALAELCDQDQARFWRALTGLPRARPAWLENWRQVLAGMLILLAQQAGAHDNEVMSFITNKE